MSEQTPTPEQSAVSTARRKVGYTTKMAGITVLGILAVSGPAAAFYDDSPILIPFLELIQQALKEALAGSLKDGFNKLVEKQINGQVDRYKKEVEANMMPGAIKEADVARTVQSAGTSKAAGLKESKGNFELTGADTAVKGPSSVNSRNGLPTYNPNAVVSQHNQAVRKLNETGVCKPIQVAPVDGSGTNISCTPEERRLAAEVLLGATPPAELAYAERSGSLGEVYESARTTMIARKQLAALALNDAGSLQKQQMFTDYRKALDKPTIEELQKLSADGGVARDEVVLKQIIARLVLENVVEEVETKRLFGVYVAQRAEADDRNLLGPLRRANAQ